jgi:hypothetical protein
MGLDIRFPIGMMFTLVGLLMTGFGLVTGGDEMYARSLGMNVNLWWGLGLLVFGGLMWFFAVRGRKAGG